MIALPFQPTKSAMIKTLQADSLLMRQKTYKIYFGDTGRYSTNLVRQGGKAARKNNLEKTGENSCELTYNNWEIVPVTEKLWIVL